MFCGRQRLALRGHDEAGVIESLTMQSHNDGNFRALLHYRACDDNLRRRLLSDSQRNCILSQSQNPERDYFFPQQFNSWQTCVSGQCSGVFFCFGGRNNGHQWG